ncbi:unnamed protein product [Withania somnifera]
MATFRHLETFMFLLLVSFLHIRCAKSELKLNYYSESCPRAEEIIKEQVIKLYHKHGNTAASWIRNVFHDCMVKKSREDIERNFGMRNFKYIETIKEALESKCPNTVSCADIVALSARDGVVMLGGPHIEMKTGRRDSKESYLAEVENFIPNHNDSMLLVLSRFKSVGVDAQGTVALLGAHSVGRVHCVNIVHETLPNVRRNDRETPMVWDNLYYKNILSNKGLLIVDQQLVYDPTTYPFVEKFAASNSYFHSQFGKALIILSENNPLTGDQGDIRKVRHRVNK